jgi:hypothetical protein
MTDDNSESGQDQAPPKIKLGLNGNGQTKPPTTVEAKPAPTDGDAPPKLKLSRPPSQRLLKPDAAMMEEKKSTTRISLSEAKPTSASSSSTQREKVETTRVDLSAAVAPPKSKPIRSIPEAKSATIQIDDMSQESLDDLYKAALNATQRVVLDEHNVSGITGDASASLRQAEMADANKKNTARIDLNEMLTPEEQAELQKKKTMSIDGAKPIPAPTVRLRPPVPSSGDSSSTISIAPPDMTESQKSETARIDLPGGLPPSGASPPSQRKTIRIKRPDGTSLSTGARAITVARAGAASSTPAATPRADAIKLDSEAETDDEESSLTFSILALVAVLVALAVVYVLAATMTPDLPFPGRLV